MSRYLNGGAPTSCAFCGQPFPMKDGHVEAVRVVDDFVCNTETCVDGINEELPSFVTKGRRLAS